MRQFPCFRQGIPQKWVLVPVAASCWLGCQDPLDDIRAEGAEPARVELTNHDDLEAAPPVVRFRIELSSAQIAAEDLNLFYGELSTYYRSRIANRDIVDSLVERRIPMLAWQLSPSELFAQPSEVLEIDATYTLVALGSGVLAQVTVAEPALPVLERRWPPATTAGGAEGGLYCAQGPIELSATELFLAPGDTPAELVSFDLQPDCALLTVADPAPVSVPEPELAEALVDPVPLIQLHAPPPAPGPCTAACYAAGPGCLCPMDDRARITGPEASVFWVLRVGAELLLRETHAGSAFVVPGLIPTSPQTLSGSWFGLQGRQFPFEVSFVTASAVPHAVINEVYADPNGPEPAQEWLELVNSGTVALNLEGYALEDAGGTTLLPNLELPPSGFAVVVNDTYQPDPDFDPLPDPSARLVRVERLGKGGLSNAGELLRLRTPDGELVSRFPSYPAPKPGVSVARKTPWSLDDDPDSFALHAPPGASPGLPNQFAPADAD